jgi:DeoR family deoxyribose operon repressor
MTKQAKRQKQILEILRGVGAATTRELSEKLSVTEMTIRRDLLRLSEEKPIKVVHGGAIYFERALKDAKNSYDHFYEETRNREAKDSIGRKAAQIVEENDTIVLGIGSTTDRVAKYIRTDIRLTVICYSLNILNTVCRVKNWETIIPGGYYHYDSWMFENAYGVDVLKKMRATKAFLGASGISQKLGVTCSFVHEVDMRKAVINSSDTKILVADSSKFGDVKIGHFAELSDFNVIVTDPGIPREYIDIINDMGITLHIAE